MRMHSFLRRRAAAKAIRTFRATIAAHFFPARWPRSAHDARLFGISRGANLEISSELRSIAEKSATRQWPKVLGQTRDQQTQRNRYRTWAMFSP